MLIPLYLFSFFFLNPYADNSNSKTVDIDSLPFLLPDSQFEYLPELLNDKLQNSLEDHFYKKKRWATLLRKKKMAVGIVDLQDPLNPTFAHINGNEMMYAASLPKLAILLTVEQAIEDGKIAETDHIKSDMRLMIAKSDNKAATRLTDLVGLRQIEKVLTDPRYKLYDYTNGGLWMGKRYAKKGKRIGDPLNNLSHGATALQVCRFYYLLAMGKLVSRERSEQMLHYLIDPEIHHKFVNTLEKIVPDAKIYRKSGTWRNYHADSALVWGTKWRRYIVVGLVEDKNGEQILRNLIPVAEQVFLSQYAHYQ